MTEELHAAAKEFLTGRVSSVRLRAALDTDPGTDDARRIRTWATDALFEEIDRSNDAKSPRDRREVSTNL